jgi:hypothetical protein
MKLLVLNQTEIERLLPMPDCIEVMTQALIALAQGQVHLPLRMVVRPPEAAGVMALMPAHMAGESAALGVKVINVFNGNPAKGKDSHQGGCSSMLDGDLVDECFDTAIRPQRFRCATGGRSGIDPSTGPLAFGSDDVRSFDQTGADRQSQL